MTEKVDLAPVLSFLGELRQNNNKPWFDQNRARYEQARGHFEQFIDLIIDEFRATDGLQDLSARDCISRIYRDIRFSKDKSPYKTNMWATIAPGGKKTMRMGYHVSLQPGGQSIIAGGMWEPSTDQLIKFRESIDRDASQFKRIIRSKSFTDTFGKLEGDKLKTAPQGCDKSHPEIDLLKMKQIMVVHYFTDNQVMASDFLDHVITGCKAMRPFLDYLDQLV